MADEVAGVGIACVSVMIDGTRASLQGAVIIDDNLIDTEDGQCSCYPAGTRYPLVGGLEAGTNQLT